MNIFSDFHHAGLYASLHYLFEGRLGHNLYRPIGVEWFNQGYWKIAEPYNNNPATVDQYLKISSSPEDGTSPLNNLTHVPQNGVHHIWDYNNEIYHKAITLDKFKEMDFDIIIASIPAHIQAYKKLIKDTGSKAKLVYQIGNIGWHNNIPWNDVDNIMASVKPFQVPQNKNVVFYRQEFNTDLFHPLNTERNKVVASFVNCLPRPELFLELEKSMPEYEFKSYGITCRDGIYHSVRDIAKEMEMASWGYHLKPYGDGFGHVIHNWFAAGTPLIVGMSDYKDKLAGELLEDRITCIDMSNRTPQEVSNIVHSISTEEYNVMRENVRNRFSQIVNFEKDALEVERFINECM